MANTTFPIHKLFRVYETLDQFDAEASHPENKICFIKDKRIIYANGVEYTNEQMYNDNITDDIKDATKFKTVYNALLDELRNRNYMKIKPVPYVYWTGDSNTIRINYNDYTADPDKINIDGVEYYQLKLNANLNNNFYNFNHNSFIKLIFKDVDTSNVTSMAHMFGQCSSLTSLYLSGWDTSNVTNMYGMFYHCSSLTSLDLSTFDTSKVTDMNNMFISCNALKTIRMVGCSQTTIDKIKAQLSADGITGCTIVTE